MDPCYNPPMKSGFAEAYKALNSEQKRAVDTIDGPVMVIAGPGTGKTQILALRIAHILTQTDTPADGVLCLTFTNAGVKAMRERLLKYIGPDATKVRISTFHTFALDVIEEFHEVLGNKGVPTLLEDVASVALFDELFSSREWEYLRPRANPSMYFRDLKSLISLLKRDRITPDAFRALVQADIERITNDPESISTRGESKGQLKKDTQTKLAGLARSLEVADFYETYESSKQERNLIDYNDALELLVRLVEESEDARALMRERHLYVLVDEHQDSSGIQNEFLSRVWHDTERPNIFVVGDDRQLIYGFGGASLSHFEGFKDAFGKAELITLTHNYRSTQVLLDAAETLLSSTLANGKLIASSEEAHPIRLVECNYPRDEILRAGLDIKRNIAKGIDPNDCAILVPKNHQVKTAVQVLRDLGLPVSASSTLKLFEQSDTQTFLSILRSINNPTDAVALSRTLLDQTSGVSTMNAHTFLASINPRVLTVTALATAQDSTVAAWGTKLQKWVEQSTNEDVYALIQTIGTEVFLDSAHNDETIRRRVEIIRTILHLILSQISNRKYMLHDFLAFVDRLESYEEDIPLAVFGAQEGIKVLTLHGSKGLEFDSVWIAHMDERSFMGSKRQAFALPQSILDQVEEGNIDVKKRELYVAMTRAKRHLVISYASTSYSGSDQQLASIIQALPEQLFVKEALDKSEKELLTENPKLFVTREIVVLQDERSHLATLVAEEYTKKKVSVTMLNNFFECPWKWYFRNLLQLPEPMTESLQVGTVVHEVIEHILKGGTSTNEELMTIARKEARQDEVLAKRLATQAQPIVEHWQKTYMSELAAPFSTERNFSYRDPAIAHLTITGKIDVVEEIITDEVRVTDWKTGNTKSKNEIEKVDDEGRMSGLLRQLAMYSYLIDGSTKGNTTVTESRLVFLEAKDGDKDAVHSRRITTDDMARLKQDIVDYDTLVRDGSWMTRPCRAKTYGIGDTCEYCAMAKIFKK